MAVDSFAVVVAIETPAGLLLIRDHKKPAPVYWKIPGGRSEPGESPETTAVREIQEEVGMTINPADLKLIIKEDRGTHCFVAFQMRINYQPKRQKKSADQEEVRAFEITAIHKMSDFLPNHRRLVEIIASEPAILPSPRVRRIRRSGC